MRAVPLVSCGLLVAVGSWSADPARGEDFRIENRVYSQSAKEADTTTTTLFHAGRVYDYYLSEPVETTVFDPDEGRFVLLDVERRLQTEVRTATIAQYTARMRAEAQAHDHPLVKFLAAPEFAESVNPKSGELRLDSRWMTYRVKTVAAPSDEAARQYGAFADWHGQLNWLVNPRTLPPFGRLALNDALKRRRELPVEVQLVREQPQGKSISLRSEHTIEWRLTRADQKRINQTTEQIDAFAKVTLEEYRQPAVEQARLAHPSVPRSKPD